MIQDMFLRFLNLNIKSLVYIILLFFSISGFGQKFDNFQLVKPDLDTVQLELLFENRDTLIIILSNSYACADCFNELNNHVDRFRIKPIVIIRSVDSPLSKRKSHKDLVRRLTKLDEFYFDLHIEIDPFPPDKVTEGVLSIEKVKITPSILILTKNGYSKLIPYGDLFKGKKGDINLEILSQLFL